MPFLHRDREPVLYYEVDDYTDPWAGAPYILLQHNLHLTQAAACATHLLHFASQHDGIACREP